MTKFEKYIYDLLKKNQKVKDIVRDFYQLIFSLKPTKSVISQYKIINRQNYFFGFHDKSPWSADGKYLLANHFNIKNRKILPSDFIDVGYFYGENFAEFSTVDKTSAFNWQQGCMLQWVGSTDKFIYNYFDKTKHISRIKNVDNQLICELPRPIAALSPDGKYALSYNFERLAKLAPGYGYENAKDLELNNYEPSHGLVIIDIENYSEIKLFSIKEIASINREKSMENAFHYFSHCLFSPSGKKFAFYHRWTRDLRYTFTRLFTCNLDGSDLYSFPTNGMVSHYGWQNENSLLAYCAVLGTGDAYYLFEDKTDKAIQIGLNLLTDDGHPSFNPVNKNIFITDTYPNRFRQSTLSTYKLMDNIKTDIAILRQPLQFKDDLRCDLHPRWNRDGTMLCFDSAHTGIRSLCILKLNQ